MLLHFVLSKRNIWKKIAWFQIKISHINLASRNHINIRILFISIEDVESERCNRATKPIAMCVDTFFQARRGTGYRIKLSHLTFPSCWGNDQQSSSPESFPRQGRATDSKGR